MKQYKTVKSKLYLMKAPYHCFFLGTQLTLLCLSYWKSILMGGAMQQEWYQDNNLVELGWLMSLMSVPLDS